MTNQLKIMGYGTGYRLVRLKLGDKTWYRVDAFNGDWVPEYGPVTDMDNAMRWYACMLAGQQEALTTTTEVLYEFHL